MTLTDGEDIPVIDEESSPSSIYLRGLITHAFGLDDCLVLLALVCTTSMGDENEPTLNRTEQCMVLVFAALSIILTTYGIGYHQETVPTADMIMMEKVSTLSAI